MALAAEPAVTGKLPGDSGGRGGSCWAPRPRTTVKREAPALCWAPRPWTPLLRPAPSLWERAAPTGPAFPGREQELPARVSSVGGPRRGDPRAHCDPWDPPCLAAGTPSWPTPLPSALPSRLGTALFLLGPAVPGCPQNVAAWRPSPKKPPAKGKVPLTAECMATAGTERIPEQSWARHQTPPSLTKCVTWDGSAATAGVSGHHSPQAIPPMVSWASLQPVRHETLASPRGAVMRGRKRELLGPRNQSSITSAISYRSTQPEIAPNQIQRGKSHRTTAGL